MNHSINHNCQTDSMRYPGSGSVTEENRCHDERVDHDPAIRFLCDAMLGRLARYLRLIGTDAAYRPVRSRYPIEWAIQEHRFLLTRDTTLISECIRNGQVAWFNPDHNDSMIQFQRTVCHFNLKIDIENTRPRCVWCNRMLASVRKSDADGEIPDYVVLHSTTFLKCPECRRIYWNGTQHHQFISQIAHHTSW